MTTTTETQAPAPAVRPCPPSDVVDMIVRWDQVRPGELVLDKNEFVVTQERDDGYAEPAYVGFRIGEYGNGDPLWIWRRRDKYTAVRRYTEGLVTIPVTLAQTAAAGLDEAAEDRDERAYHARKWNPSAEQEHTQRAAKYRQARNELIGACRG